MAFGTLTLADLQATVNASTVYEVGYDRTFEAISNELAAHNRITADLFGDLAVSTTARTFRYGGTDTMTMEDGDELAVPRAQKVTAGSNVGFPLNMALAGLQWTELWFKRHTLAELTAQVNAMMSADIRRIQRDLKRALALSTNYTHTDHLVDNVDIPVKRLVNADSAPIPPGPNGEAFTASSHTHYIARVSTLAASDVTALITTVREHFNSGPIRLYINAAQEAAIRGFTSNFTAYLDPRLVAANNALSVIPSLRLDQADLYDRPIGIFDGAEVMIKPWVPANYMFALNLEQQKPLAYRYDPMIGDGLQLVYDNPGYPLLAKGYRRCFGFGVQNRVNGAWLFVGGTSWSDPSIN